jgi:hypothetical protein
MDLARIGRQHGFDETGLIVKRLRCLGRPWRRLAVSEQVHRTDAKPILQIVHQSAPLARTRYAGMHQHDHGTGGPRFDEINVLGRNGRGGVRHLCDSAVSCRILILSQSRSNAPASI